MVVSKKYAQRVYLLSRNRPPTRRVAYGIGLTLLSYGGLVLVLESTRGPDRTRERVVSVSSMGAASSGNRDPFVPFTPPAEISKDSPFFPSGVSTTSGGTVPPRIVTLDEVRPGDPPRMGAETCDRCHPDVVAQWDASAHRFSSLTNPFYLAPLEELREKSGRRISQWCAGCHDPALLFPGEIMEEFDLDRAESHAGLTCLTCHAIDRIHNITGNGNFNLSEETSPYLIRAGDEDLHATPSLPASRIRSCSS